MVLKLQIRVLQRYLQATASVADPHHVEVDPDPAADADPDPRRCLGSGSSALLRIRSLSSAQDLDPQHFSGSGSSALLRIQILGAAQDPDPWRCSEEKTRIYCRIPKLTDPNIWFSTRTST
jgi:hypothetical protein